MARFVVVRVVKAMPRVNIGKPTPNNVLLSNISKYMTLRCMDKKDLAPATGSMTTLNRRLKCPEAFTLGELRRISKRLGVPLETLMFDANQSAKSSGTG